MSFDLVDCELDLDWFHPNQKAGLVSEHLSVDAHQHPKMNLNNFVEHPQQNYPLDVPHSAWEAQAEAGFLTTEWNAPSQLQPLPQPQPLSNSTDNGGESLEHLRCAPCNVESRAPVALNTAGSIKASGTKKRRIECVSTSKHVPACCRCSGGCRNSRCACVKAWGVCAGNCKCTNCRNPFKPMQELGVDFLAFKGDECLVHNLSKIKNMRAHLTQEVATPCCQKKLMVKDCLPGVNCPKCDTHYTYSWCSNKLCDSERAPRNHCSICKRCGDYRDRHCEACGHCYFAGVTGALRCPCQQKLEDSTKAAAASKAPGFQVGTNDTEPIRKATVKHVYQAPKATPRPQPVQGKPGDGADECCIM